MESKPVSGPKCLSRRSLLFATRRGEAAWSSHAFASRWPKNSIIERGELRVFAAENDRAFARLVKNSGRHLSRNKNPKTMVHAWSTGGSSAMENTVPFFQRADERAENH